MAFKLFKRIQTIEQTEQVKAVQAQSQPPHAAGITVAELQAVLGGMYIAPAMRDY
ncbi:MAG: hypothetical protein ACT4OM_04900 [Actinomycetota bacterium]